VIKLKEVIIQLEKENYFEIEKNLIKNKADRFLLLFRSYKNTTHTDKEIRQQLGVNANAFYVLKSRLYDKIQESLSCDMFIDQEKTIKLLLKVPEICLSTPRETAIAYLEKLEKELNRFDMHNELLIIYSALKKMHLYSDKYYYYSQLYNKQVSFGLSLEKSEELLGTFCRLLMQYDLSKSTELFEKLNFIKTEIINIYNLCTSRQIELIKNLVELQLIIFCSNNSTNKQSAGDLIQQTRIIFDDLPATIIHKKWELVLDYLCFEYYYSINSTQETKFYYEKVNDQFSNLFLYNHICFVSHFLISKIKFCEEQHLMSTLYLDINKDTILYDPRDEHAQILICLYHSMIYFDQKKYKEAIELLVNVHDQYVLKNYSQLYLNIKLTLIYYYIVAKEYDKALFNIKTVTSIISRKIKATNTEDYNHLSYLIKAFNLIISKDPLPKNIFKQRDFIILFMANNHKNKEFLAHLIPELKRKYQI
jgi:hypothetical protein